MGGKNFSLFFNNRSPVQELVTEEVCCPANNRAIIKPEDKTHMLLFSVRFLHFSRVQLTCYLLIC